MEVTGIPLPLGVQDLAYYALHGYGSCLRDMGTKASKDDLDFLGEVLRCPDKSGDVVEAVLAGYNLGWLYANEGNKSDSIRAYQRALKLTIDSKDRMRLMSKMPGQAIKAGVEFDFQQSHCKAELELLQGQYGMTIIDGDSRVRMNPDGTGACLCTLNSQVVLNCSLRTFRPLSL